LEVEVRPNSLPVGNLVVFAVLILSAGLCAQSQGAPLKPFLECNLGSQFQIAQVDGPVQDFAWPTDTKAGKTSINVETGYRVLVAYLETELFGNLKVERLPAAEYQKEKSALLSSLDFLAIEPGMDGRVQTGVKHGFNLYGVNRSKLEGGVLSIYNLFDDNEHVAVTMYLLNDEPANRKFDSISKYVLVRDAFLESYTSCLAQNLKTEVRKN
jgi:hypothetical protein